MAFNVGLSFVAAGVTIAVIAIGIYRGPRSFVQGVFAFGMLLMSLEAALTGLVYQSNTLSELLFRQRLLFIISSLVPAGCSSASALPALTILNKYLNGSGFYYW